MSQQLGKINILVIDDDTACAESLSELIAEQTVYKTFIAQTCQQALDLFCPYKFSIAFVDLNIDGSVDHGIKLIERLRKLDQQIIIVVVSAYAELIYNKVIIECVDDFVRKPIDVDFFYSKLFLWGTSYERRAKLFRYVREQNNKIENRINTYEAKLEAIKSLDYQISQISSKIEASIPGEDDWCRV
jgi:DNA-binding NtrC family response regulator